MHLSAFLALMLVTFFPVFTTARNSFLSHVRKVAIKHSSTLARDLRTTFGGLLVAQPGSAPTQNFYCISSGGGGVIVGGNGSTTTTTGPLPTTTSLSPWTPIAKSSGSSFFDDWTFFTAPDPTDGNVQYVSQSTAQSAGLIEVNSAGNAVMRVETTPTVQNNRMSVRITSNVTFTQGLVVLDAVHMPTGCGTWPAFWTNGPNWPNDGEIDIVEGVNNYTDNQATIHTGVGCSIPTANSTLLGMTGTVVGGTDCSAAQSNNEGCGVRFPTNTSFGSGFNSVGGGVFAMYWNNSIGIQVWYFQRGSIPGDITAGAPHPENWPTPNAYWPNSTGCNISNMFKEHNAIFDTTLCGDWAEGVWNGTGVPGQSISCAAQTGFANCAQFVQANGASFNEAYWEVSSVTIYQDTSAQ